MYLKTPRSILRETSSRNHLTTALKLMSEDWRGCAREYVFKVEGEQATRNNRPCDACKALHKRVRFSPLFYQIILIAFRFLYSATSVLRSPLGGANNV